MTVLDRIQMERLFDRIRRITPAERLQKIKELRAQHADEVDQWLATELCNCRSALLEAQQNNRGMKELLDQLSAPPLHQAVFRSVGPQPEQVTVSVGTSTRAVRLGEGLTATEFQLGDEVFLNSELNVLVCKGSRAATSTGQTARFERATSSGQLVLNVRDETLLVEPAGTFDSSQLQLGDLVYFDPNTQIAYHRVERGLADRYLIGDVPQANPHDVGGQQNNLRKLIGALTASVCDPTLGAMYGLTGRRSIMMIGPPGCGKTLMARVAASEISRLTGRKCRFAVVKPAEWESPWVGETQHNIRECFRSLRQTADEDGFVVLFLDEVESIARIRGSVAGHHSDKFLAAFLAETEGFADRGNVAIISATNQKSLIAPEAYERLSEVEIVVQRPNLEGCREIFGIHMGASIPYSPNGSAAAATRREIIERAVSRLCSPNGDNELCTIRFRDGRQRKVSSYELVSGRLIGQLCRNARESALLRHATTGQAGVQVGDMEAAVTGAIDRLTTTLTPHNVRSYLSDLPQDLDVVSVEPVNRRVKSHRHLN